MRLGEGVGGVVAGVEEGSAVGVVVSVGASGVGGVGGVGLGRVSCQVKSS